MKNLKFLILVGFITLLTCERDDICAESTPTTPRLIIEFYDATSVEDLKSVPRLTAYGEGLVIDENGNEIAPIVNSDKTLVFNANVNELSLPLIVGNEDETTLTRYILEKDTNARLDDDDTTLSNIDILEIRYTPEFIYVSRACGYKSIFTALSVTRQNDTDNWITSIQVDQTEVENENSVHVRIFH